MPAQSSKQRLYAVHQYVMHKTPKALIGRVSMYVPSEGRKGSIFHPSETKANNASIYSPRESFSGKGKKSKLSKSDIGTPTNFKHVTHVGFNAMSGLDEESGLKILLDLAGIQEEELKDKDMSCNRLDKEGDIEAMQRMTRRMTSVERPTARIRLRSLSSSSITPSKRQNVPMEPTKIAATLSDCSPFSYLPSWSKVPPPISTANTFGYFPSMLPPPPVPPYLELSPVSPANHPVRPSRDVPLLPPLPPRPQIHKVSKRIHPPHEPSNGKTSDLVCSVLPCTASDAIDLETSSVSEEKYTSSHVAEDSVSCSLPPSVPGIESSLLKFGDVPSSLPPFSNCISSETILSPPLCLKSFQSKTLDHGTAPPAPPFPFKIQSTGFTKPYECSNEYQPVCQRNDSDQCSDIQEPATFSEVVNEPSLLLDQIRQGVQLKSVGQTVKLESAENCNIVSVLRDVIQKRHKAIHSSDEEDNGDEEEWED